MKRMICLLSILLFGLVLTSDAGSQRRKAQRQTRYGQAPAVAQQEPAKAPAKRKLTAEEKVLSLKGERVIFFERSTKDTGTISEVTLLGETVHGYPKFNLVITLDGTGEKIEGSNDNLMGFNFWRLGFFSEREAAKKLIGVSFWVRGFLQLERPPSTSITASGPFLVGNTQKVTVSGVEWSSSFKLPYTARAVALCFRTALGQEGCWLGSPNCFDNRFQYDHDDCVNPEDPSSLHGLYSEDPHKLFPGWSKAVWELIESGEIAIGMSEKMAEVACGDPLGREGSILSSGDAVLPIYNCGGKKFIVVNGKVAKYVVSR